MDKKTLRDVELKGKRVVMRVDFNVPMAKDGSGKITDDTRIVAALPSIKYVLEQGGSLVLMSHLGRPKGVKLGAAPNPDNAAFTLKPVAEALSEKLGLQVKFVPDCMAADDVVKALKPGEVALLENTRFYKAEDGKVKKDDDKKGIHLTDEEFAAKKAELKAQRAEIDRKILPSPISKKYRTDRTPYRSFQTIRGERPGQGRTKWFHTLSGSASSAPAEAGYRSILS